jgi:hypothetical protein
LETKPSTQETFGRGFISTPQQLGSEKSCSKDTPVHRFGCVSPYLMDKGSTVTFSAH